MRLVLRSVFAAILAALLAACGGGGANDTLPTVSPAQPITNAADALALDIVLGPKPVTATVPTIASIIGSIEFPAIDAPATLVLSASQAAPEGVSLQRLHTLQSAGSLTVYEYVSLTPKTTVTMPSIPAMSYTYPASTSISGKAFYYGFSDPNAQGGLFSFDTQGPAQVNGNSISFSAVPTPLTLVAGHKYTFIVYATATTAHKIYVANAGNNTVTSYNLDGTATSPTIHAGLSSPISLAVDPAGKIYVANAGSNSITTYNPDGSQTTPTITVGLSGPIAVGIDASRRIHVLNNNTYTVTTYNPDGSQTTPTITGLNQPSAMAVDPAGKVYITNYGYRTFDSGVTTYNADGSLGSPHIQGAYQQPEAIAVGATGNIYVDYQFPSILVTYAPDGTLSIPTLYASVPYAFTVDNAGKIYSTNPLTNMVDSFDAGGSPTNPTITTNVNKPSSVAVH